MICRRKEVPKEVEGRDPTNRLRRVVQSGRSTKKGPLDEQADLLIVLSRGFSDRILSEDRPEEWLPNGAGLDHASAGEESRGIDDRRGRNLGGGSFGGRCFSGGHFGGRGMMGRRFRATTTAGSASIAAAVSTTVPASAAAGAAAIAGPASAARSAAAVRTAATGEDPP